MRLKLDGKHADIQVALNYYENRGKIVTPIEGDEVNCWAATPKMNGIYLLSYLSQNNFDVSLINSYYKEKEDFRNLLNKSPKAVIISTTFIYRKKDLYNLIQDIRSLAPDIFIIVGGPFVNSSYRIFNRSEEENYNTELIKDDYLFFNKNEPLADFYIISPKGEKTLKDVLFRIKKGIDIDNIDNSAYFVKNKYYFTRQINDISDTDNFQINWQSLPQNIFSNGVVPMQASMGCHYKCSFCNFVKDPRLTYLKPLEQLIDELKSISKRGARYVWFTDDNFRLGNYDLNLFCSRIIEENIQIRWQSFIRANTLKNADLELLHRSGCIEVQMGLESTDIQILKNMNKKADSMLYKMIIRELLSKGINCSCYFIFGFPGETDQTVAETIKFMKDIESSESDGIFTWSIYPFLLAPMSPIYEIEMRQKFRLSGYMNNWQHETMNSSQAIDHIKKAFFDIENSGPIHRGDNLDILYKLNPKKRKEFIVCRHELGKLAVRGNLEKDRILQKLGNIFS